MEQLFLARGRPIDVEAREDALFHELAVEVDFGVTGALELFENDLIHARAGVDQRRGDDREASALLDIAGRAKEALRLVKGVRVDAAREDLAAGRDDRVVGARQS